MSFLDVTEPDDREENRRRNAELAAGLTNDFQFEKRYRRKDGRVIWVRTNVSLIPGPEKCSLALVEDITERKKEKEELRTRERQLREAQTLALLGSWEWDPTGDGTAVWSDELRGIFGVGPDFRPSTETFLDLVVPEDRERIRTVLRASLDKVDPFAHEYRIVRGDGTIRSIHSLSFVERDDRGVMTRVVGVAQDVTEREGSLAELRALSVRLQTIREDEARRIAREVHDEIGQSLTALAMDVAWLERKLTRRTRKGELLAKLEAMSRLVRSTTESVQRISSDLRPGVLDELGLEAAAEWAVSEFADRTGVQSRFASSLNGTDVDPPRATAVFRILQEALTNVARHAAASRLYVSVTAHDAELRLMVRDNGVGIEAERVLDSASLGLLGMRERARSLGGTVEIGPAPRHGTAVCARIPL